MAWTLFDILVYLFQALLILRYVKRCFVYPRAVRWADVLLALLFTGYLSLHALLDLPSWAAQGAFVFPALHALVLSREPKSSMAYWLMVLLVLFNLVSVSLYPFFDLLPVLFHFAFMPSALEKILLAVSKNVLLFLMLELAAHVKKSCPFPLPSAYTTFIFILAGFFIAEEAVYNLYLDFGYAAPALFLVLVISLFFCILLSIFLFHTVSQDAERAHRYQAEISMLSLSKQHQMELAQMYEELTQRQHDYKHHLQALEELVRGSDAALAQDYFHAISLENQKEELFVTGCPEVDALLTAKRRLMRAQGVELHLTPYPLASLPVPPLDFCSILGNLLDNAIEGVARVPSLPEKPVIRLAFSRSWDMFYLYCENPCDPSTIVRQKERFVSSKQKTQPGLHGIGLHSVETIVSQAQGRAEFSVTDQLFCAKIVLPYLHAGNPSS